MVFIVKAVSDWVDHLTNPAIKRALQPIKELFLLEAFVRKSPYLLQEGLALPAEVESARQRIYDCLAEIRPNAVPLVDSWDFKDRELRSVLGRYDGNVYPNLFKWAQHSTLNRHEVLPAHHKYFGPMMREARSKL